MLIWWNITPRKSHYLHFPHKWVTTNPFDHSESIKCMIGQITDGQPSFKSLNFLCKPTEYSSLYTIRYLSLMYKMEFNQYTLATDEHHFEQTTAHFSYDFASVIHQRPAAFELSITSVFYVSSELNKWKCVHGITMSMK